MREKYNINTLEYVLTSKYLWHKIKVMRYTFKDFKTEYPDDQTCLVAVLENRYGSTCPRCGVVGVKWHPIKGRKGFVCSECDRHIYPLAETIFRKSETSLWNWFYAIYQFSVAKNGVSAKELERTLGVTYKTAWRMAKQIRLLMQNDGDPLTGDVEVDETYIGGKHEKKFGYSKKNAVFGAVERGGMAKAVHVKSTGSRVLLPVIDEGVSKGSNIYSDEWRAYTSLKNRGYSHATVTHSKLEYVRGLVHTNTIEGFWGQLKNSLRGTYHAVSPKYLQSYVDEFVFRYNYREVAICPVLLERAAKLS
jgi:transposase-like protein